MWVTCGCVLDYINKQKLFILSLLTCLHMKHQFEGINLALSVEKRMKRPADYFAGKNELIEEKKRRKKTL